MTFCRSALPENKRNRVLLTMWRGQISFCSTGNQELKTLQKRFGEHYGKLCKREENGHCDDLMVNTIVACYFGSYQWFRRVPAKRWRIFFELEPRDITKLIFYLVFVLLGITVLNYGAHSVIDPTFKRSLSSWCYTLFLLEASVFVVAMTTSVLNRLILNHLV